MLAKEDLFEQKIKIFYKKLPGTKDSFWPIIDINLPNFYQPIGALVDSGASHSIIHEELAKALGLSSKNTYSGKGLSASGSYSYWDTEEIKIKVLGREFLFKFKVIKNKDLIWPCILGHDSIFRIAKLEFKSFKGQFTVSFRTDVN